MSRIEKLKLKRPRCFVRSQKRREDKSCCKNCNLLLPEISLDIFQQFFSSRDPPTRPWFSAVRYSEYSGVGSDSTPPTWSTTEYVREGRKQKKYGLLPFVGGVIKGSGKPYYMNLFEANGHCQ